jgi:hypothetical protein
LNSIVAKVSCCKTYFCTASVTQHPPVHHPKNPVSHFWMGWNPTPGTVLWGGFHFFFFFFPHAPDLPRSVLRKTQLPTQTPSPPGFRAPPCSLMFHHALRCYATLGEAPSRCVPWNSAALLVLLQRPAIARGRARSKELEDIARNHARPQARNYVLR